MARVTLAEQPHYEFYHSLSVRFTDVNMGGHLATDALVGLLQEARAYLLKDMGFSSFHLGNENVGLVIADLIVNFRQEGAIFDTLKIESHFDDFGNRSFRLYHRITRDGKLLALAETGLVCFDYVTHKPTSIPDKLLDAIQEHQISVETSL